MRLLLMVLFTGCGAPDTTAEATDGYGLARGVDTGAALPLTPTTSDDCPDNPAKDEPGACGCDYADADVGEVGGPSCVHIDAEMLGTHGVGVTVERGASVAAGAHVGDGGYVGAYAQVGANANVGAGAVIGRWATGGASAMLGPDTSVGREADVGANVDATVGSLVLGCAASLGGPCRRRPGCGRARTPLRPTWSASRCTQPGSVIPLGCSAIAGSTGTFGRTSAAIRPRAGGQTLGTTPACSD